MLSRFSLALACLLAIAMFCPATAFSADTKRPNIVLILADDLGYGDLGCYGHPTFKTPYLDRLAQSGARLTQFNTPMPYCAPTRAALLTGRYPFRNGMTSNPAPDGGPQADALGLALSEKTLADVLAAAGYATAAIGKWHLGHQPQFLPTRRGFQSYFGIPYSNDMRPVQLLEGEKVVEYPVVQTTLTRRYTARAVEFIEQHRDRPFFLFLPHVMPHKPLAPGEAYFNKSGAGLYGDVVADLDAGVGDVLAALAKHKLDEQTLVLFTSDNGPWFGGSSGGLRGMKSTSWEGGYRVPLIARWPGQIPAGHVNRSPAIMMDLFATILAATGVAPPAGVTLDGRDIMPLLKTDAASPHEFLIGMLGAQWANIRSGQWKLHAVSPGKDRYQPPGSEWKDARSPDGVTILAPAGQYHPSDFPGLRTGDPPAAWSLFDLEADPGEQKNVAAEHPEIVARLKKQLERAQADWQAAPREVR